MDLRPRHASPVSPPIRQGKQMCTVHTITIKYLSVTSPGVFLLLKWDTQWKEDSITSGQKDLIILFIYIFPFPFLLADAMVVKCFFFFFFFFWLWDAPL